MFWPIQAIYTSRKFLLRMTWIGRNIQGQIQMMFYCILVCSVCYVTFIVHIKHSGICDLRSSAMLLSVDW